MQVCDSEMPYLCTVKIVLRFTIHTKTIYKTLTIYFKMKKAVFSLFALALGLIGQINNAMAQTAEKAVAITEVFGDGQQVVAVAVKYDNVMNGRKIQSDAYSVNEIVPPELRSTMFKKLTEPVVEKREVEKVYSNTTPEMTDHPVNGEWVILELKKTYHHLPAFGRRDNGEKKVAPEGKSGDAPNGGPVGGGARPKKSMPLRSGIISAYKGITRIDDFKAEVLQVKPVKTAAGKRVPAFAAPLISTSVTNLIVDDFDQYEYVEPISGIPMAYNLFVPRNYDPSKKYPLVLFMPDAEVTGWETTRTLTQGIGATIWATPEEQAKHPCFVLAPDYTVQIINDEWETNEYLDATVALIGELTKEYSIDTNRLYTTGQSGGCMLSFAIDNKYPDLFAASLLMAGKWDPSRVSNFTNDKMWMLCGEGDKGAFPSMTSICNALREKGVRVAEAQWNGRSTPEQFNALCAEIEKEDAPIRFVHFIEKSVFPDDEHTDGMEHLQTWRVTYTIEGVRDWLFRQHK